ncbi:ComEC/Rec2 family competence protein [Chryseobacterium sp. CT-SW4]|uniref:ComEC/Rec2 family competence protein n=1 Tax=Chryseobacterium sp. SW-1 TaxID=3157343 RepID=UPI003B01E4CE
MNKQPLLILVTCFILGIIFQDRFLLGQNAVYCILFIALILFVFTFLKLNFIFHKLRVIGLGCIYFGVGVGLHYYNSLPSGASIISSVQPVVFKITKKLNSTEKYKRYEVEVRAEKGKTNMILLIADKNSEPDFMHYYKAHVFLKKLKAPEHDFQFNYARYLKRRNIEFQAYVKGEIIPSMNRNDLTFHERLAQKRHEFLRKVDRASLSPESREFLKGMIFADRTEMDALVLRDFTQSGLMHLLVISGTHIVIIFGLMYFFLIRVFPLALRKWAIVLSLAMIWIFGGLVGFENSVLRSCIMLTIYYVYKLLGRKPDLLHSLAVSAFIILIGNTQQLFNIGFQLSFIAVLGIFWLNDPILNLFPKGDTYWKRLFFSSVCISLAAQLSTLPVILYYFHQCSLISLLANIFIVPFSEIIIISSFILALLIVAGLDGRLMVDTYDLIIQFLLKIIHWFAGFESFFIDNISINWVEVLFLFIVLGLLKFLIQRPDFRKSAIFVMTCLFFFILHSAFTIYENQRDEILIHHYNKSKILSVKIKNNACFWLPLNADKNKIEKYIVGPYRTSRRLGHIEIKYFSRAENKVIFRGKTYDLN